MGRSSKVSATVRVCAATGRQLIRTSGDSKPTRRALKIIVSFSSSCSGADGGAEGVGERLAEALDIGFVFGFDHDASELLGTGVAKDDAAIVAKRGLGFGQGAGNFWKRLERRFRAHFYVDDELRIILETLHERFNFTAHGNQRGNFCGREQAVTGRAVVEKNDVAGLLASQHVAAAKHFFENVAIPDGGAGER